MMIKTMFAAGNDAELVRASLAGNREAFGHIVGRYQALICSLAYSATGSLNASEDLAQETFLTAWRALAELREPEKLRSWLCAIARNLINNSVRRQGREPSHRAEALENAPESPSPEPHPIDQTISNEEQAILWRSLEQVPELYREPMILFYRENQSVETVAQKLELTEDAVKQRLARGRKLLHEQVAAFVEGALARSTPGKAFTVAVLAALPASLTVSAKAATLGAAAKTGAAVKAAGLLGLCSAIFSPLLGLWGTWEGYRVSQQSAWSEREREYLRASFRKILFWQLGFCAVLIPLMIFSDTLAATHPALFVLMMMTLVVAWCLTMVRLVVQVNRGRRRLRAELSPQELAARPARWTWEYRSRREFLGQPLVHFRFDDLHQGTVKAWIAAGDCAVGRLFAYGGVAVAPISVGACAIGLVSSGALGVGVLTLGGMAAGVWCFAGIAFGWQAFGGCAAAWDAAWGGCAVAHNVAAGGVAVALQANTPAASEILMANPFFRISSAALPYLFLLNLFWIAAIIIQKRMMKRLAARSPGQPT